MLPLTAPRRVHVIIDPEYGPQLTALPISEAVWVIDSPRNTPVARLLWTTRAGITTFRQDGTPEQVLLAILNTVDEHEGEDSTNGGYAALHIVGCPLGAKVGEALAYLGLSSIETTETGFVAERGLPE